MQPLRHGDQVASGGHSINACIRHADAGQLAHLVLPGLSLADVMLIGGRAAYRHELNLRDALVCSAQAKPITCVDYLACRVVEMLRIAVGPIDRYRCRQHEWREPIAERKLYRAR